MNIITVQRLERWPRQITVTTSEDPRGSLAGAQWPREPNPPHKLNVFIITAKLHVIPRLPISLREAGHAQTSFTYGFTKFQFAVFKKKKKKKKSMEDEFNRLIATAEFDDSSGTGTSPFKKPQNLSLQIQLLFFQ